jgi:hypothetical protein
MKRRRFQTFGAVVLALSVLAGAFAGDASAANNGNTCASTVTADVVAIDQPYWLNRLGALNADGQIYVLRHDTVTRDTQVPCVDANGNPNPDCARLVPAANDPTGTQLGPLVRNAMIRPDKRPRPIALRVNAGQCLEIKYENWVAPQVAIIQMPNVPINPFGVIPALANGIGVVQKDDQFATRANSIHVNGMQLVNSIDDDGSYVGRNANSLVCPTGGACPDGALPGPRTYKLYAEFENVYFLRDMANTFGGDGGGGTVTLGLFGAVMVEPAGAQYFRSNSTNEDMLLAQEKDPAGNPVFLSGGQPKLDYDAVYPNTPVFQAEGKVGIPVLKMICDAATAAKQIGGVDPDGDATKCGPLAIGQLAHTDHDAIITGPTANNYLFAAGAHHPSTTMNPRQDRPFREFGSIWNDEQTAVQAFPQLFLDPVLLHTLKGTRDGFMINYASGGIGSEIIANRLGLGPMWNCVDCKAEEFFLTSWAVGDPGHLVDVPANFNNPLLGQPGGPIATTTLYPHDTASVHNAYLNDHVKFRNVHAGPFEHHIFHLHGHQWVFAPQSDKANYQDMQQVGPGSGYTMDIANGGAGNRHKTPGDAIYHCHFYPHFAQGMWAMWRNHEVFEEGTPLEEQVARAPWSLRFGTPLLNTRAYVDGEVKLDPATNTWIGMTRGVPVQFVVPIPGYALAPMPSKVWVDPADPRKWAYDPVDAACQSDTPPANPAACKTPGFPFWIAGVAGHRPSSPPLDIEFDGGLPRHVITSDQVPGHATDPLATTEFVITRLDLNKELLKIGAQQFDENGTQIEKTTMAFHEVPYPGHVTTDTFGNPARFEVNGLPRQKGAPMADPCRDSLGQAIRTGQNATFYDKDRNAAFTLPGNLITRGGDNPRDYRIANIQVDLVFNKMGWHHAQNRIISLWDDIAPTYTGARPAEPMVFRLNTGDCAKIHHVNLTPNFYELDDYEIRFPTDIIGQHTHMPKFDLPAADGAANGWNYEDGSLSPGEVHERIHALNVGFGLTRLDGTVDQNLAPVAPTAATVPAWPANIPFPVSGARINIQRWMADPVLDNEGRDRGLGNVFTHDHFGPSTFQQLGLYATVLAEPAGSVWRHNETNALLGDYTVRQDGGPTSWQAVILPPADSNVPGIIRANDNVAFREFYFEYSDFQSAYERNWDGIIDADSFLAAINPSVRIDAAPVIHPILTFPGVCPAAPGTILPRPCPEGISLSDVGTQVYNYRNEPIGLRVFDNVTLSPIDNLPGRQAVGKNGDMAYAWATRARTIFEMGQRQASCIRNTIVDPTLIRTPGAGFSFADIVGRDAVPAGINHNVGPEILCAQLTGDVAPQDPATPLMRVYNGDRVKIRAQVGATEESHDFSAHGIKWLHNYADPNSGWENNRTMGISEQFQFDVPIFQNLSGGGARADFYYAADTSNTGNWNGEWGLLRAYNNRQGNLVQLPNNLQGTGNPVFVNDNNFRRNPTANQPGMCPITSRLVNFDISVVRASDVLTTTALGQKTLFYNSRAATIPNFDLAGLILQGGQGPLHDPTALMYVPSANVLPLNSNARATGLVPGTPVEPLVLRANSGDCIQVTLRNRLPRAVDALGNFLPQADQDGFTSYPAIVDRVEQVVAGVPQKITFNANDTAPSSYVGIHPQLLAFDVRTDDGFVAGNNPDQLVAPGASRVYQWYAGDVRAINLGVPASGPNRNRTQFLKIATPIEFGVTGLLPADKLEQGSKGLVGALVIHAPGTTCTEDAGTRAQATCSNNVRGTFRDVVAVTQSAVNQLYATPGGLDHLVNPQTAAPLAASFRAVQNFKAEGVGAPADDEDSGQKAVNYKTEPQWFRLAQFPPHIPLEAMRFFQQGRTFSNTALGEGGNPAALSSCLGNPGQPQCDPETPIYTAKANDNVWMRFVEPAGSRRSKGIKVHGHLWQRAPWTATRDFDGDGKIDGPTLLGDNPVSNKIGSQIGFAPAGFFNLYFEHGAGGFFGVDGDYFYGMQDPSQTFPGMWGVLRVSQRP